MLLMCRIQTLLFGILDIFNAVVKLVVTDEECEIQLIYIHLPFIFSL